MSILSRILGEAMTPYQRSIYRSAGLALDWARETGQRFPEAEPYIAKDPYYAFLYARNVLKRRWPEAEDAIAADEDEAYWYAKHIIKGRWKEAEATILKSDHRESYLRLFPEARDDWIANGWMDWLDT